MQELNYLMKTTPDNLDRRATLIRQLKEAQHNLMNVIFAITQDAVPEHHTCRDFRAKYPDDVLVDQINGESQDIISFSLGTTRLTTAGIRLTS